MIRLLPLMLTIFLLLQMTHLGYGRSIIRHNTELVSDGSDSDLVIENLRETTITCEPLYGFLPCTTNIWGQLFMIVIYQYLFYEGEKYISNASENFQKIHGQGSILGGSLFQILATFPQLFLVLASGLLASTETAEQQAAMGMQLLAGSVVMMLTLVWGSCVFFGSYNLPNGAGFGVIPELKTRWIARIMLLSMIPVIILQLTKMINSYTWSRVIILVALIVTVCLLIVHCTYQVTEPWILEWRFGQLLKGYVEDKICKDFATDGEPDEGKIGTAFDKIDADKDEKITADELRNYLVISKFGEYDFLMGINDCADFLMMKFDNNGDGDGLIERNEFHETIRGWIEKYSKRKEKRRETSDPSKNKYLAALLWLIPLRDKDDQFDKDYSEWVKKKAKKAKLEQRGDLDKTEQKFGEYDVLMRIKDYVDKVMRQIDVTREIDVMREIDSKQDEKIQLILDESFNAISGWIKAKKAKLEQQGDPDKMEHKFREYDVLTRIKSYVDKVIMREIHSEQDEKFELDVSFNVISGWINEAEKAKLEQQSNPDKMSFGKKLVEDLKAILEFLLGVVILVVLSTPNLQTVQNFSATANIAQFFIPYVIIPLVLNIRTTYHFINTVREKKEWEISLTLSKIYQSVYMNNLIGLTTFLALVYGKNLSWDVSAEVFVVLIIYTTIGLVASFCEELQFWKGLTAIVLYPVSLLLLHVFRNVLGWS